MAENDKNAIREIPKHDIHVKASTEDRSLMRDLGKGVMDEIIVPKSKEVMRDMSSGIVNMFADALRNCIDRILYPDGDIPSRKSSHGSGTYTGTTNYTSYSRPINNYQPSAQRGRDTIGQRPGNEVKYIWVPTEDKAIEIRDALRKEIKDYGKAKVASLYEMIEDENGNKMRTTFADFKYGWTDPSQIGYYYDSSRRVDEFKWFLDLDKPVDITNI